MALVLLFAARAGAQSEADKKHAQALQMAGVRLLDQGDNRGALQKFEEAIRVFPSPKILFNMGRAHAALGEDVEAVNDFERFLDEAPYAPKQSRDEAERIIQGLRAKLSYIEIGTGDVGSRISVDGHEVGMAPLARPLAIAPGTHEVRLEQPGMLPETRTVSPVAGQKVRVFVKLRPVSESKTAVVAPPPATGEPPPAMHITDAPPPPPPPPVAPPTEPVRPPDSAASVRSGSGWHALKWIAWGAAVAGAGVGAYGSLHNSSLVSDFDNGCGFVGGAVATDGSGRKTLSQCNSLRSQYQSAAQLGIGGFVSAGVLAAAGFAFWATEMPAAGGEKTARAFCAPSVSATLEPWMSCVLRF